MRDTTEVANRRYHELLRERAPHERLAQAMALSKLSKMTRELAMAGLRSRHPDASAEELRIRLAVRLYGREVAMRLFGGVREDAV